MLRPSQILRQAKMTGNTEFPEYKSPYGPKYQYAAHIGRANMKTLIGLGWKAGAFGGVAGIALIFYASGIPRIQRDILSKIPFVGSQFVHEVPASDNPF